MQICKFQPHNIVKHTFADKLFDCVWPFCGVVPERFKFLNAVNFIKNYMKMSLEKHNSYSRVTNSHGLFQPIDDFFPTVKAKIHCQINLPDLLSD